MSLIVALSVSQVAALEPTGGITGRVTADGTNAPIAGARVLVFPAGRPMGPMGPPPRVTTDQDGRFAIRQLPPGEYRLDVQKPGFAPLNAPMTPPRTFTVTAGQALSVDLRLQRGAVIAGRVFDAMGEPLTEVRIMAMRRMPQLPNAGGAARFLPAPVQGPQQTNDLGEFRVAGLAPGEYIIAALPRSFIGFGGPAITPESSARTAQTTAVTTFYPGTADQAAAQAITVAAGAEVGNIVFTMQSAPAFRVSGVVVDESGAPIENAMVTLMADPRSGLMMGPIGSGRSDAGGRFTIGEVPAGTYRANASIMMSIGSTGSGRGGVSGGVVWSSGSAAVGAGSSGYFSMSSSLVGGIDASTEVVVADADVRGVRVVARRPNPQ